MKISTTILAHPIRRDYVIELEKKLKTQGAAVDITWDKTNNQWETAEVALKKGVDSDWHIVLEDDAVVGDNFYSNALKAIKSVPEPTIISFYIGTGKPFTYRVAKSVKRAKIIKPSWLWFPRLNWGVAIAINSRHILSMFELEKIRSSSLPYDQRLGQYFKILNRKVYYTFPSIVDHRDEESINKVKPAVKRVAHLYSDDHLNFNGNVIEM